MEKEGVKPFVIVKRVLAAAGPDAITLRGTLNDLQLHFRTGEVISFDGKQWRYIPAAASDKQVKRAR